VATDVLAVAARQSAQKVDVAVPSVKAMLARDAFAVETETVSQSTHVVVVASPVAAARLPPVALVLTVEFESQIRQFVVVAVVLSEAARLTPSAVAPVLAVELQMRQPEVDASPRATTVAPLVPVPVTFDVESQKAQF